MFPRLSRTLQRWRCSCSGSVAIIFAVGAPVLVLVVAATVEYTSMVARHSKLQTAVDAATLAATQQLRLSSNAETITNVARAIVLDQAPTPDGSVTTVTVSIDRHATQVTTTANEERPPLFARVLNLSSLAMSVTATARVVGQSKICVIALESNKSGAIMLDGAARLTGMDCVVQSNSNDPKGVASKSSSILKAVQLCSSGGYEGSSSNFAGDRLSDCPRQPDPLASRAPPPASGCASSTKLVIERTTNLYPGVYCEGIEIKAGARVSLSPGTYVMKNGGLKVDDDSQLIGRNIVIYFTGANANFDFLSTAFIDLSAPKDGELAGILFFGDRSAPDTREYKITSDYARNLLGTIYLPRGFLTVDAKSPVADQSAYTAIIAQRIELKQSPNLVLNTRYEATDVPVPTGLAPTGGPRLVR